ncbi:hypothetical protein KCU98_g21889, partial [Aureobasidium melanogenum]
HSQLKTGHPVRSAIHKQLNGRLVLRWVTTWESLLLYVLLFESTSFSIQFYAAKIWLKSPVLPRDARERALAAERFRDTIVDASADREARISCNCFSDSLNIYADS